jgi:hypothetical protein
MKIELSSFWAMAIIDEEIENLRWLIQREKLSEPGIGSRCIILKNAGEYGIQSEDPQISCLALRTEISLPLYSNLT